MSEKTLIIIGAGIAGLSAACYARMNGYNARILEMHDSARGLCTSWNRKGYIIDGCLQWLVGAGPNVGIYRMGEGMGAVLIDYSASALPPTLFHILNLFA